MCGIVGFTGNSQAAPILLDGLSKLEYRGYDSAGMAVRDGENQVSVVMQKGVFGSWPKRQLTEKPYRVPAESVIPVGQPTESRLKIMRIRIFPMRRWT